MKLLFADAETAFSSEYSLSQKSMTTQKYIRDPRFKVHGWGLSRLDAKGVWLSGERARPVLEALVPQSIIVGHNLNFDVGILEFHYGIRPGGVIDTLSLSRAMIGGSLPSHSLDSVAKLLLGVGKGFGLSRSKGLWDLPPDVEQELADYCVHRSDSDIELTKGIFKKLIRYFPREELPLQAWCIKAFTQPKIKLNSELLEQYLAEVREAKAQALVSAGLESRDVLMSNPRYAQALEELGVQVPTKISPTTGKESFAFAKTDEGHKALLEHEDIRVQALVAARLEVKSTIEETRAELFLETSHFGPVPVEYKFSGADQTHRFSGGGRMNWQNLRRGGTLRDAVEAPEGYVFVVGDLAQIEARITMGLAGETEALDAFRAYDSGISEDVYCWFGSKLYKRKLEKSVDKAERQISKSAFLGCGFGAGDKGLKAYANGSGVPMDADEAQAAVKTYRDAFPGVVRMWRICDRRIPLMVEGTEDRFPAMKPIFKTGHEPLLGVPGVQLLNGLWVKYPNLRRSNDTNVSEKVKERLGRFGGAIVNQWVFESGRETHILHGSVVFENLVQFTARQIIMEHLLELDKYLPVVMTTHDEVIALAPEAKAETACRLVKKIMATSPSWWPDLPLASSVGYAKSYGRVEK